MNTILLSRKQALTFIVTFLFCCTAIHAQRTEPGTPASFTKSLKSTNAFHASSIETIDLPILNNDSLKVINQIDRGLKNGTFAHQILVALTPENSGTWTSNEEYKIWRLAIKSETAYSLNLIFNKFHLPERAQLFLYSPDHTRILGAYTANNNKHHKKLAIQPMAGNELIVEYNEPLDAAFAGELEIGSINHDFTGAFRLKSSNNTRRPMGVSQSCQTNINCSNSDEAMQAKQSVVRLIVNGKELGTGTLVNNSFNDGTPYVISAGHCFYKSKQINTEYAETVIATFNYESPTCSSIDGFVEYSLSGGTARAWHQTRDMFLLELDEAPSEEYNPFYAGWSIEEALPESAFCIHHPMGDVKKISISQTMAKIGSFLPNDFDLDIFWHVIKWLDGGTEGGSSGSALFNGKGQILGTLSGGGTTCTTQNNNDFYSKIHLNWNQENDPEHQLECWLNPAHLNTKSIPGYAPFQKSQDCSVIKVYDQSSTSVELNKTLNEEYLLGNSSENYQEILEFFPISGVERIQAITLVPGDIVNQNQTISLNIYSAYNNEPRTLLHTQQIRASFFESSVDNYIPLKDNYGNQVELEPNGSFFVGIELNYSNASNQFSLFSVASLKNSIYVRQNNELKSFSSTKKSGGQTYSLLLSTIGCGENITNAYENFIETKEGVQFRFNQTANTLLVFSNTKKENCTIEIYSTMGLLIREETVDLEPNFHHVNLDNLIPGVYIVTVQDEQQLYKQKVVVH